MRLTQLLVLSALVAIPQTGSAEDNDPAPGRYAISPMGDGVVRLDTMTGDLTYCSLIAGAFSCSQDRDAGTAHIDRQKEIPVDEMKDLIRAFSDIFRKIEREDRTMNPQSFKPTH